MGVRMMKGGAAPRPAGSPRGIFARVKGAFLPNILCFGAMAVGSAGSAQGTPGWVLHPPGEVVEMQLSCRFSVECIDSEPCADTTYEAQLQVRNTLDPGAAIVGWAGQAVLNDISSDSEFSVIRWDQDAVVLASVQDGSARLISRAAEGATRYSLHMPDVPMAITYLGTCEEVE